MAHMHLKPKPNERPNKKKHVKKDSNGLPSKWQKSSWASNVVFMGQKEDVKIWEVACQSISIDFNFGPIVRPCFIKLCAIELVN